MSIELSRDDRERARASLRRFFDEQLDHELGRLQADLLIDFFLRELGPTVFNQAVARAQAYFQEKAADLDASCYEPEFRYWER